jgi:hypothetical protein
MTDLPTIDWENDRFIWPPSTPMRERGESGDGGGQCVSPNAPAAEPPSNVLRFPQRFRIVRNVDEVTT